MTHRLAEAEFIPLMAAMQALTAMSIDAMLPALGDIGRDLRVANPNDVQLVISAIFGGMIFGGLVGGPLSDSTGRKTAIYWGLGIYILGSILAATAGSFQLLLVGRVMQGFGSAIPATVAVALTRDLYQGDAMARIMSYTMSVFILVPIVAPLIGQTVLLAGGWRLIFSLFVALAVMVSLWFGLRQPETLPAENRAPFAVGRLVGAAREVAGNRPAMGYAIASGILFGAFLGYLSSSQQIFQDAYGVGRAFPLYFSSLAASFGLAMFLNGSLVMRFGMRRLTNMGFAGLAGAPLLFLPVVFAEGGLPPLWTLLVFLAVMFFCFGALMGNLNAMSMTALGHIAGVAAAIIGSMRFIIGMPMGIVIARRFDGTILPLVTGFAVLALLALVAKWWAGAGEVSSASAAP